MGLFDFFSSDSASSSTSTTTTNTDKRQVVDGGAVGISSDQSTVTFNQQTTDQGSVNAGRDVALAGIATNATNVDHLLAAAEKLFTQQQNALDMNANLTKSLAATAQAAYADASSNAQGNKPIVYAVVAVIGIAMVSTLKAKK